MIERILSRPRAGVVLLSALLCAGVGSWAAPLAAQDAPLADARLAFARGVAAYHDGDFESARERFEEAVELAPEDGAAHHWLGLTHLNLGHPEDAVRSFERSLRADVPPPEPAAVRERLAEVRRRAERRAAEAPDRAPLPAPEWIGDFRVLPEVPRFDGRLYLGAGHDSNPNLLPDDLVLATPDGEPVSGEDSDTVILANARLGFQAVDEVAGRTFGVALHGSQSLYDEYDYLDFRRLGAVASFALGKDPAGFRTGLLDYARTARGASRVDFLLQVGLSRDWLDGEELADRLEGAATLGLRQGARGQTRLSVGYRDFDFDGDPSGASAEIVGRSGEQIGGELDQYLYFGSSQHYLRLGAGLWETDAGDAFDRSSRVLSGELSLPAGARSIVYLVVTQRTDDYDEPVSNLFDPTGEPREDDVLTVAGSLVVKLSEHLRASGRASWTDHEIGQPTTLFAAPDLSYERTFATLGLTWIF